MFALQPRVLALRVLCTPLHRLECPATPDEEIETRGDMQLFFELAYSRSENSRLKTEAPVINNSGKTEMPGKGSGARDPGG